MVMPRRLTWVEERAVGSKGSSSWVLMHGRRRVMLVVKLRWGGWHWSGLGYSATQYAGRTIYQAKAEAEAFARRTLEAAERAEMHRAGPSSLGGGG